MATFGNAAIPTFAHGVAGLAHMTRPGGRVFLLCFSDEEPGTQGAKCVSQRENRESFADGSDVEEVRISRLEVRPDPEDISFGEGGPRGVFSMIRRVG